jgi:hypothetical protein
MPNRSVAAKLVVFVLGGVVAASAGCGFGESGIEPPDDRIFLPGGLAVDPNGRWLYTVNSNSDLRFNAGTVVAVDADKAEADYRKGGWQPCPSPGYLPDENGPGTCCKDFFDPNVLNCDDRLYVDPKATVRIGSFGGNALTERRQDMGVDSARLYIAVRSEPSVTFIDLPRDGQGGIKLVCEGTGVQGALCDDAHKIRGDSSNSAVSALKLVEEPHAMALDPAYPQAIGGKPGLGLLYVGHLLEGISVIDTCNPAKPELLSINRRIFFGTQGFAVTSIMLQSPGDPLAPLLATGRSYNPYGPGEVQSLKLEGITGGCGTARGTGLLVESQGFYDSAFFSEGSDIRGLAVQGTHAFVLHRNATVRQNAPAVVEIDQSPDAQGVPHNRAVGLVEVCAGATEMLMHDAGRGPRLYVVCFEAGQIYVVDPAPLSVAGVINVGRGPTTMVFAANDPRRGYVLGFSDNNISVVDLDPASLTENRVIQRIGFPQLRKR